MAEENKEVPEVIADDVEEKVESEEEEEEDDGVFRVKVKGGLNKDQPVVKIEADPEQSVEEIKVQAQKDLEFPVDHRMVLCREGVKLDLKSSLASLGVTSGSSLELKHQLKGKWTMWYDSPDPNKKPDPNNWHSNINKIISIDTIEDFWGLINNLTTPSRLVEKSNYYLFREGIEPAWEDEKNAKGGKWELQLNTNVNDKKLLDEIWLNTMLEMIGSGFDDVDEICGACVNLRKSRNRVAIWTRSADSAEALQRLGQQFKAKMSLGPRHKINFTAHNAAPASRGKAKPLYTI